VAYIAGPEARWIGLACLFSASVSGALFLAAVLAQLVRAWT
jgi:hypothetical protein